MENIIKVGDESKLKDLSLLQRFVCDNCGCIFETSNYTVHEHEPTNSNRAYSVCPWCDETVVK